MKKGTFAEFPKPGVDFEDILLKTNEEAEPSRVPDSPTLRGQPSESSVQPQESPRPSLEDAAPEDQDVSFSSCNMPWSLCLWWPHGPSVCSTEGIFLCPKVDPKISKPYSTELVELKEHERNTTAWGSLWV